MKIYRITVKKTEVYETDIELSAENEGEAYARVIREEINNITFENPTLFYNLYNITEVKE